MWWHRTGHETADLRVMPPIRNEKHRVLALLIVNLHYISRSLEMKSSKFEYRGDYGEVGQMRAAGDRMIAEEHVTVHHAIVSHVFDLKTDSRLHSA